MKEEEKSLAVKRMRPEMRLLKRAETFPAAAQPSRPTADHQAVPPASPGGSIRPIWQPGEKVKIVGRNFRADI